MSSLDFSAPADSKVGNVTISIGDMFSGNNTRFGGRPAAKVGDLSINVGNVLSGNHTWFGGRK
jgi:hypothetical protein